MRNKIKVVFYTGSGISAESGVPMFRAGKTALWHNHSVDEVCTLEGFKKNAELVLDFYNHRRRELDGVLPNAAHNIIAEFSNDENFDVQVITTNCDDLHEKSGSKNVVHLHGSLRESRSSINKSLVYQFDKDLEIGDKAEDGGQLRPNVTWFGENLDVNTIRKASKILSECDILVIVGTSLLVEPSASMVNTTPEHCKTYYVDPIESLKMIYIPKHKKKNFIHIKEVATVGVVGVVKEIKATSFIKL